MNNQKERFLLTQDEKRSPVWLKLKAHWEERLNSFRLLNDTDRTDIETAKLRGQIAEIKSNLALHNDLPVLDKPPL